MPRLFATCLIMAALILIGCKREAGTTVASDKISIGEYGSMTGTEATFGLSTHEGIMLAVDQINSGGGVLGKKIEIISEDDQGSQDEAVTVVKKLINRDHVSAILGEVASSNSLAGGAVCQNAQIPMISPSSTNPSVTKDKDYVFRTCFTDDFQASVGAQFGTKQGWKNVALLTAVDSDYSKGLAKFFRETFTGAGGTLVADESYSKGDREFRAQLTKIKAANPDAVYLPGYYTQIGLILRQARDLGLNCPFFGGDGWDSEETLKLGSIANGCYFTNHYSPDETRPEVQAFVSAYEAKYKNPDGSPKVPDAMAVTGYDAARVLADSIKRAGSTDSKPLRDAIASTKDFPGASGIITIDENRNARKPIIILEIRDGKTRIADTIQPK
ncbi:MAG TPA: ABC transporter substrate-binding protein [Tepidisphaeraceae bacterium]|nr:ABC transporter substrate-binding protein [Tepidisphaeraceae bacterium]